MALPQRFFLLLITLAIVLKAAVPFGYMPDARALADGVMRIRICTGMGAQNIWVDKNMKEVDPSDHHDKPRYDGDCVFAVGLHFSPGYQQIKLADVLFAPALISFRAIAQTISYYQNPAAPLRAPPVLS